MVWCLRPRVGGDASISLWGRVSNPPVLRSGSPQRLRPLPCSVFSGCCTSPRAWLSNHAAFRRTPATQLGARHWALWKMTRSFEWAAQPHSTRERSEPNDLGLWDVRSTGRSTKNDVVADAEKVSGIFLALILRFRTILTRSRGVRGVKAGKTKAIVSACVGPPRPPRLRVRSAFPVFPGEAIGVA